MIKLKLAFTILVLTTSLTSALAQYSPIEPEKLSLENYSRSEIRRYLINTQPAESEVYYLARKSRKSNTWSIVWYSASGLFVASGISALAEMNRLQNNGPGGFGEAVTKGAMPFVATSNFGLGGVAFVTGILQTRKSRKRLNRAIELYRN